jgi:hypothetical protein
MTRVTLPREVAEAIETLKQQGYTEYGIITLADDRPYCISEEKVIFDYLHQNFAENSVKLMSALVNGYEIEKSPEEKVREYYNKSRETLGFYMNDATYNEGYYDGVLDGIKTTLDLLEIKVPGVNAPVPGVNADA